MFLGQVVSLYFIIMGVAMFINRGEVIKAAKEFAGANASMVFYGAIVLIIGLLMVLSHNVWDTLWQALISFVGWAALVKGTLAVVFPKLLKSMSAAMAQPSIVMMGGLVWLIAGVYLALQVF